MSIVNGKMTASDFANIGFAPGITDHYLIDNTASATGYSLQWYHHFKCSCGMLVQGRKLASGGVDNRTLRMWKSHLDNVQVDSHEIYHLGRMKRKSGWMDVYIFPLQYSDLDSWLKPGSRYSRWIKDENGSLTQGNSHWYSWIVGTKVGNRQTIKHTCSSKNDAMIWARNMVLKEQDKGIEVEFSDDQGVPGGIEAPALKANASILTILGRIEEALEGKDVKKIEEVTEEVIDAIALLPILQGKKDELTDRRQALLTKKFAGI